MATCAVPDCGNRATRRGWCKSHYSRWLLGGDVRADVPLIARPRIAAREPYRPPARIDWSDQAACKDRPDLPWVTDQVPPPAEVRACVDVCLTCPVIDRCADHAITNSEFGIWGGMTDAQRGATRQDRAHARKAAP